MAAAGQDFGEYRRWLDAAGVDTSQVLEVPDKFTASFFCSTDTANNQIASFYKGAMAHAGELSFRTAGRADLAIISPNDPGAMVQYAEECRTMGLDFIFDPGQQCARMSGSELQDGLTGARMLICNDYEYELIREKTGLDQTAILERARLLVVTRGEQGASVFAGGACVDVPAVPPVRVVDPTGVGDAYRAGFMKGLALGASDVVCARLGSVAATYVLEHLGGQSHAYTWNEFAARYATSFGPLELSARSAAR
jgi:adenosine kinase